MEKENIDFYFKSLSPEEIANYLKLNDNDYFQKLSNRIDIDDYAKKLHQKSLHFTLYEKDKLVGFSPCYFDNKIKNTGYVSSLTIRDGYRGFGLGGRLLMHIKAYAKKSSFIDIKVSVHCDNKISINFYKKNTFEIFEQNDETNICTLRYAIK